MWIFWKTFLFEFSTDKRRLELLQEYESKYIKHYKRGLWMRRHMYLKTTLEELEKAKKYLKLCIKCYNILKLEGYKVPQKIIELNTKLK